MPLSPPSEVVLFLNVCGIPYPDVNEDHVREMARHVREFAAKTRKTSDGATSVVRGLGSSWSGQSYDALCAYWERLTGSGIAELHRACKVLATSLDTAATVITAIKAAVIAELTVLATSYTTSLAASIATSGASAALTVAISTAARRLCSAMRDTIIAYLMGEVIGKALEPLEKIVSDFIEGLIRNAPVSPGRRRSANTPLDIDIDAVKRAAELLDAYADEMLGHAADLTRHLQNLDFSTPAANDTFAPPQHHASALQAPRWPEPEPHSPDRASSASHSGIGSTSSAGGGPRSGVHSASMGGHAGIEGSRIGESGSVATGQPYRNTAPWLHTAAVPNSVANPAPLGAHAAEYSSSTSPGNGSADAPAAQHSGISSPWKASLGSVLPQQQDSAHAPPATPMRGGAPGSNNRRPRRTPPVSDAAPRTEPTLDVVAGVTTPWSKDGVRHPQPPDAISGVSAAEHTPPPTLPETGGSGAVIVHADQAATRRP